VDEYNQSVVIESYIKNRIVNPAETEIKKVLLQRFLANNKSADDLFDSVSIRSWSNMAADFPREAHMVLLPATRWTINRRLNSILILFGGRHISFHRQISRNLSSAQKRAHICQRPILFLPKSSEISLRTERKKLYHTNHHQQKKARQLS